MRKIHNVDGYCVCTPIASKDRPIHNTASKHILLSPVYRRDASTATVCQRDANRHLCPKVDRRREGRVNPYSRQDKIDRHVRRNGWTYVDRIAISVIVALAVGVAISVV